MKELSLPTKKKILIFGAHSDDDVFALGAVMKACIKKKNSVKSYILTSSPRGVPGKKSEQEKREQRMREGKNACDIIGSKITFLDLDHPRLKVTKKNKEIMTDILKKEQPDLLFVHPQYDIHNTHKKVFQLCKSAVQSLPKPKRPQRILAYETWTPLRSPTDIFFFSKQDMKEKQKAMKKYVSQLQRTDYSSAFEGLCAYRAALGSELLGGHASAGKKVDFAEVFEEIHIN